MKNMDQNTYVTANNRVENFELTRLDNGSSM